MTDVLQSHTILGSRSQRGMTQLALDVLFQHAGPQIAQCEDNNTVFPSLCAADVSEAHLVPAGHFLDSMYGDGHAPSRAATPALVSADYPYTSALHDIPGAFPEPTPEPESGSVFERPQATKAQPKRLYPSLSLYKMPQDQPFFSTSRSSIRPVSRFGYVKASIAKLTGFQETSFLSAPSSRRYAPRLSALPQFPAADDLTNDFPRDDKAEYAIVVSMYEVYNDRIFDLLCNTPGPRNAKQRRALLFKSTEHSPDRKVVAGLRKVVCGSLDEALLVLETGLQERRVAGTGSNATSSRSHGFFCVEVKKRHRGSVVGPWTSSSMTIVDLAGEYQGPPA